jgi:hypothetical protein
MKTAFANRVRTTGCARRESTPVSFSTAYMNLRNMDAVSTCDVLIRVKLKVAA